MANLTQRLGLVGALGLAGVVGSGCETRLEISYRLPQGNPEIFCRNEESVAFTEQKNYAQITDLFGLTVRAQPAYTVETTFSCGWGQVPHSNIRRYPQIGKKITYADGTVVEETKPGDPL